MLPRTTPALVPKSWCPGLQWPSIPLSSMLTWALLRSLPPSWFHFHLLYSFILEFPPPLRKKARTKTCSSSFLGKGGNELAGLGPERLGQGSRLPPSLSWALLPDSASVLPHAFVHRLPTLPPAGITALSTSYFRAT